MCYRRWDRQGSQVVGRFFGFGFQVDLKAHIFLSSPLSHLALSILGLNFRRFEADLGFVVFVWDF